jgi:predicted RNA polymerase sigma factor
MTIEALCRSESGRVLATLVRLLGDTDLAEESMHEAFAAALEIWTRDGIPDKPCPWLISTARFKAIDTMRRTALWPLPCTKVRSRVLLLLMTCWGAETCALFGS